MTRCAEYDTCPAFVADDDGECTETDECGEWDDGDDINEDESAEVAE